MDQKIEQAVVRREDPEQDDVKAFIGQTSARFDFPIGNNQPIWLPAAFQHVLAVASNEGFGALIRRWRHMFSINSVRLAQELTVTQPTVSRIESGRIATNSERRLEIMRAMMRLSPPVEPELPSSDGQLIETLAGILQKVVTVPPTEEDTSDEQMEDYLTHPGQPLMYRTIEDPRWLENMLVSEASDQKPEDAKVTEAIERLTSVVDHLIDRIERLEDRVNRDSQSADDERNGSDRTYPERDSPTRFR